MKQNSIRTCNKCYAPVNKRNRSGLCYSCAMHAHLERVRNAPSYLPDVTERQCPECNRTIKYTSKFAKFDCKKARDINRLCSSCAKRHIIRTDEWKQNISTGNLGKKCHWAHKVVASRRRNGTYTVTEETREKLKIAKIERLAKTGKLSFPNYNDTACKFFDEINEHTGWHGRHAMNGGEARIGCYWVDYYVKELQLVIEWDEEYHKHRLDADKIRQTKIESRGISVIRISHKEYTNQEILAYVDQLRHRIAQRRGLSMESVNTDSRYREQVT